MYIRNSLASRRPHAPPRRRAIEALLAAAFLTTYCGATPVAPTPPVAGPPTISCPASQQIAATQGRPLPVVYGSPSVVGGVTPVALTCTPASGSTFPIGPTQVTCTATDTKQRVSSCSLTVTVVVPPQLAVTSFAAFGDSITKGEDGNQLTTTVVGGQLVFHQGFVLFGAEYPTDLLSALKARYTTQSCSVSVANLGNPGESVSDPAQALDRFRRQVLPGAYKGVLLMEGSNDTFAAYYNGVQVLTQAINNLQTMVRQAKSAGLRVHLGTLPPQNSNACVPYCRGVGQEMVPIYNAQVRAVASNEGVALVDVFQAFGGDLSLLSGDGLHPNAAGFQRIADTFLTSIQSTLELATPGPTSCSPN